MSTYGDPNLPRLNLEALLGMVSDAIQLMLFAPDGDAHFSGACDIVVGPTAALAQLFLEVHEDHVEVNLSGRSSALQWRNSMPFTGDQDLDARMTALRERLDVMAIADPPVPEGFTAGGMVIEGAAPDIEELR